jgi:uncharacterized OB-fold protein
MAPKESKKPLPRVDEENRWFFEACARRELFLQRCEPCGALRYYPRALCPACLSTETKYQRMSGHGTLYTFTVTYQNQAPGFRDELPYVMAYVQLDEGPRILTNIVHTDPQVVRIGMPVEVVFEDFDEGLALPKFQRLT